MKGNLQSDRLSLQQLAAKGEVGIFDKEAKKHDRKVSDNSLVAKRMLEVEFPKLTFRYRKNLTKQEINESLHKIDKDLGVTTFLKRAKIIPDGGLIEVKDDAGKWRVVVVSEAKYKEICIRRFNGKK